MALVRKTPFLQPIGTQLGLDLLYVQIEPSPMLDWPPSRASTRCLSGYEPTLFAQQRLGCSKMARGQVFNDLQDSSLPTSTYCSSNGKAKLEVQLKLGRTCRLVFYEAPFLVVLDRFADRLKRFLIDLIPQLASSEAPLRSFSPIVC
ncbi:hypothetical protein GQ600_18104 [Phytophthora cactorum]|nr:hypothetical protein GQ600_18104 [Phytophthora cactorum]